MFSPQAVQNLKKVYVKDDSMWKILFNGIHEGFTPNSRNFSSDIFKKLDCYGFRLLDSDDRPVLYGLCSDKDTAPLKNFKEMYDVRYIEYARKEGWELCSE